MVGGGGGDGDDGGAGEDGGWRRWWQRQQASQGWNGDCNVGSRTSGNDGQAAPATSSAVVITAVAAVRAVGPGGSEDGLTAAAAVAGPGGSDGMAVMAGWRQRRWR